MAIGDFQHRDIGKRADFFGDDGKIDPRVFVEAGAPELIFRDLIPKLKAAEADVDASSAADALPKIREVLAKALIRLSSSLIAPSDVLMGSYGAGSERLEEVNSAVLPKELSNRGITNDDVIPIRNSWVGGLRKTTDAGKERLPPMTVTTADSGTTYYLVDQFYDVSGNPASMKMQVNDAVLKVLNSFDSSIPADTSGAISVSSDLLNKAENHQSMLPMDIVVKSSEAKRAYVVIDGKSRWLQQSSDFEFFKDFPSINLSSAELDSFKGIFSESIKILSDDTVIKDATTGTHYIYRGGVGERTFESGGGFKNNAIFDFFRLLNVVVDKIPSATIGYTAAMVDYGSLIAQLSMIVHLKATMQFDMFEPPEQFVAGDANSVSLQNPVGDGHQHTWKVPMSADLTREFKVFSIWQEGDDHGHELWLPAGASPGQKEKTLGPDNPDVAHHVHEITLPSE